MAKEFAIVDKKIKLLAEHFKINGQPFSVEGRDWLIEHLFIPWENTAFKLWHRNIDTFNKDLMGQVGMVVEWTPELVQELADYEAKAPGTGLRLVPIMVIVHNLPRGSGKTSGVAGCCVASLAIDEGQAVAFAASAFKQSATLIRENYKEPIESSPKLSKLFEFTGDRIIFPRKGANRTSFLELVETSHSSITGRRRKRIIIDEARDVEGRTFTALLPSLRARTQLVCKFGHCAVPYVEDQLLTCNVCKGYLYPHIPKLLVSSTSGLVENNERSWFMELVDSLEAEPNGFSVLFKGDDVNPSLAKVEAEMMDTVFSKVASIATYLDIEMNNVSRRKGQDFLTKQEVKQIVDPRLTNLEATDAVCVGFLDTSRVADLTSLVIVANDGDRDTLPGAKPDGFRFIKLAHLKFWNPKDPAQCPKGSIDRLTIEAYLADILWRFPNMIDLTIDVRGSMAWAIDMLMDARAGKTENLKHARGKLKAMSRLQGQERNIAWGKLEDRVKTNTLKLFNVPRLLEEFEAVRRVVLANGDVEIRDRNRKVRHADLLEGLVQCTYRIHRHMVTPRVDFGSANTNGRIQQGLRAVFGDTMRGGRSVPPLPSQLRPEDF